MEMKNLELGEIRIGASDMTLQFFLLPYLEQFHERFPNIKVGVTNAKFNVWLGGEKYKKTCPLEIERLQTLPDNYTEFGMDESGNVKAMPKTRRFEAIGNGWTVDVIAHILSFMKRNGE